MNPFENNIITIYSEHGKKWLSELPYIIKNISHKYSLSTLIPINNLSYYYILSGFQNNLPIILKLSIDSEALFHETKALEIFHDYGVVKILAKGSGFLLLMRAIPGTSLKNYWPHNDNESIKIVAQLLYNIHQVPLPKNSIFPNILDWLKVIDHQFDVNPEYLIKARKLKTSLINSSDKLKLLHGDVHHDNILNNQNVWQLIDPKGVIGEQAFEIAYFIRSPIHELINTEDAVDIIQHRANKFANIFNLNPSRILDWCYVQTIMSQI